MRLFIAVYPSDEALAAWKVFQKSAPAWPVRWTKPDSLHLTLKFLGETETRIESRVNAVLEKVAKSIGSFSLTLRGGGTFGGPSTFWTGLDGDVRILKELAHIIELDLKTIGFQSEENAYQPHMTVARVADKHVRLGSGFSQEWGDWIQSFVSDSFSVKQLSLVESRQGPSGSTYNVRRSFVLN